MKNLIFEFNDETYAVHHGAIYFWHHGAVSNIPYAMKAMNKGWIPYAYALGQKPLTDTEIEIFEAKRREFNKGELND